MEPVVFEKFIKAQLLPGDILLFDHNGFFSRLIKFKRGERYSHVEVFKGGNKTLASRNGLGVAEYDLNVDGLAAVYRVKLKYALNMRQGLEWFKTVDGQGYDWMGLLSFAWAKYQGRENGKMFCSEFLMRFMRACGVDLFSRETDADAVSPGMVPYSDKVDPVWVREDKQHG